jgi:hypothetical protein
VSIEKIAGLVLFIVGIGGVLDSLYLMLKSWGAKKWKLTHAIINRSTIEEDCDEDGCSYVAKINYSYDYNGKHYKSDRIAFGYDVKSLKMIAKRMVQKYNPNLPSMVYVNPKSPKESVLLVGIKGFHFVGIVLSSIFIAAGIYILNNLSLV